MNSNAMGADVDLPSMGDKPMERPANWLDRWRLGPDSAMLLRLTARAMRRWWQRLGWWLLAGSLLLGCLNLLDETMIATLKANWQPARLHPRLLSRASITLWNMSWLLASLTWLLAARHGLGLVRTSLRETASGEALLRSPAAFALVAVQGLPLLALQAAQSLAETLLRESGVIMSPWGALHKPALALRLSDDLGSLMGFSSQTLVLGLLLGWHLVLHPRGPAIWGALLGISLLGSLLRLLPSSYVPWEAWNSATTSAGLALGLLIIVALLLTTTWRARRAANWLAVGWLGCFLASVSTDQLRALLEAAPAWLQSALVVVATSPNALFSLFPWFGLRTEGVYADRVFHTALTFPLPGGPEIALPWWMVLPVSAAQMLMLFFFYRLLLWLAGRVEQRLGTAKYSQLRADNETEVN
ncbi:hypothetical protein IT575_02050 [bacterium]|nr:hypothetical protein [bacterium]